MESAACSRDDLKSRDAEPATTPMQVHRPGSQSRASSLRDLSFVIPIRIDSEDRLENCATILRFLMGNFPDAEILLIEQDASCCTGEISKRFPSVRTMFDFNPGRFSKSNAINRGILAATREFLCMYDTDVLLHPQAIHKAVKILRRRITRVVIPFNRIFVDVAGSLKAEIAKSPDMDRYGRIRRLSDIEENANCKVRVLDGGIMVADREVLLLEGGYNKKMVSYGWEDTEFFRRLDKLGYFSLLLPEYNLVHLDHRRGPDSQINEMYDFNRREFEKTAAMNRAQLREYVDSELDISLPHMRARRSALRRRQDLINLCLEKKFLHLANKLRVHAQVHGAGYLVARLVHA